MESLLCSFYILTCVKSKRQMKKEKIISAIFLLIGLAIISIQGVAYLDLNNAVAQESLSRVELLLKIGFDPNTKDSNGFTPLHFAAIGGSERITNALIQAGADVNALDDLASSPLDSAASFGHKKVVELLIKNNATIVSTLIFSASFKGHSEIVSLLLDKGLSPNQIFLGGTTALHAVAFGDHVETAKILLENDAIINKKKEEDGFTPLHSAAFYGAEKVAKILIEQGAVLNIKDNNGLTPDEVAHNNGHTVVEEMLKTAKNI